MKRILLTAILVILAITAGSAALAAEVGGVDDVALTVYLHETIGLWRAQVVARGC